MIAILCVLGGTQTGVRGQEIGYSAGIGTTWYDVDIYQEAQAALRLSGSAAVQVHPRLFPRLEIVWVPPVGTDNQLFSSSASLFTVVFGAADRSFFGIEFGLGAAWSDREFRSNQEGWFLVFGPALAAGIPIGDRIWLRPRAGVDWFYAEPELFVRNLTWALPHVSAAVEVRL